MAAFDTCGAICELGLLQSVASLVGRMKVQSRLFAAQQQQQQEKDPWLFPPVPFQSLESDESGVLGALSHSGISAVQESAVPSNWPILLEFEQLRIPFLSR